MRGASEEKDPVDPAVKAAMSQAGLQKLQAEARKAGTEAGAASGLLGHVPYEINALMTASWQLVDGRTAALLGAGVESELLPYRPLLKVSLATP